MRRERSAASSPVQMLRTLALRIPDTDEGIACEGTTAEKRTIRARGKAFLFLGPRDAMLKLDLSLAEARVLEAEEPDRYRAGTGGWVKVTFGEEPLPRARLEKWIRESHRIIAGDRRPPAAGPATKPRQGTVRGGAKVAKKKGGAR